MALARMGLDDPSANPTQNSMPPIGVHKGRKYSRFDRKVNPDWSNSYWQTGLPCAITTDQWTCYLEEKGFYHKSTDSLTRLTELAKRCARGRQSYDAHSYEKLRELIEERDLGAWVRRKATKNQLVQCLEAADDAKDVKDAQKALPQFHRFFELPAELRNRVYIFYLEALYKVPPQFVVPALCRASRQLRMETTGLFFEHCTFTVSMKPEFRETPKFNRHGAQLHYHTELARINIPTSAFARIKHLFIELRDSPYTPTLVTWFIDLTRGHCVKGRTTPGSGFGTSRYIVKGQPVQDVVKFIMAREGLAKLKKSDLDNFEVAVGRDYHWRRTS